LSSASALWRGAADADEPLEHEENREDREECESAGLAQDRGEELGTREEYRSRRDEKREAHAPEVTDEQLATGEERAEKVAGITSDGKQGDGAENDEHGGR
jgi:hypothetical protein